MDTIRLLECLLAYSSFWGNPNARVITLDLNGVLWTLDPESADQRLRPGVLTKGVLHMVCSPQTLKNVLTKPGFRPEESALSLEGDPHALTPLTDALLAHQPTPEVQAPQQELH